MGNNMFGNLGELAKMMSKAKDIQGNLKKFKEEMPTMEFSAASPGCQVKVTVSGDFRVKSVEVSDEALQDRAGLEEQITVAVNAALAAAKTAAQEKMNEVTGGLGVDLPGIF
ncbi:MAG: YbaB/EbfC family nucleoid-associated protein [Victivallales bacterium]|jgi:DNA-binding YbaB/EbfC family protein|nr:YbaB/EbfC family nucleoid-associated protein [Victivallales bacterium]